MKKKTVLITVSIILLMSTLAWAFWPAIGIRAGLRLATSQGAKRVVVQAGLSQGAAREAARLAVVQNKPDLAWKVVNTTAALMGISYLVSDIGGLKNKMETEIPVQDDAIIAKYSDGSSCFLVETFYMQPGEKGFNYTTKFHFVIDMSTRTGNVTLSHSRVDMSGQMVPRVRYRIGSGSEQTTTCIPDYEVTYTVINGDESDLNITYQGGRADEDIDDWIDNNPEAWLDPSLVTNTLTDTAPSNAQDMGQTTDVTIMDEVAPDPSTGAVQDPQTGLDQTPVENPDDETDTYTAPSQPSLPIFDPTMDIPDKMSIPDKITDFLNNAPFMNVINNFEVNASSGSSSLTFTVWGRNYQWDFSRYEDFYNMMATVILALAYIWSAQIVFGGRA